MSTWVEMPFQFVESNPFDSETLDISATCPHRKHQVVNLYDLLTMSRWFKYRHYNEQIFKYHLMSTAHQMKIWEYFNKRTCNLEYSKICGNRCEFHDFQEFAFLLPSSTKVHRWHWIHTLVHIWIKVMVFHHLIQTGAPKKCQMEISRRRRFI